MCTLHAQIAATGIPFQRSTIVMYYNKDAFRAAGLNPDAPPATWDEMVSIGKKLTKKSGGNVNQWGAMIPSTGYPYWMFGALSMQNGQTLMNGDGNETKDYFDYYESIINGVSQSIVFDEGFTYGDFTQNDHQSIYTLTNIIDGTFGMGISTDPTVQTVNCLVTTGALKKGGITKNDYPRFAGKVINLVVFDVKKEIADFSEDGEMNVLSGMYGPEQRQKYKRNGNLLTYTNSIELSGDTEKDKVKYDYDNKILFENNKPKEFKAFIDQTGLNFNKWTLTFDCRDYNYTEEEIAKAGEFAGKPKISKDIFEKLKKRVPKN